MKGFGPARYREKWLKGRISGDNGARSADSKGKWEKRESMISYFEVGFPL